MERSLVRDARERIGQLITLRGFVQAVCDQKVVQFIILRDPTGLIQLVAERSEANRALNKLIAGLTRESAIEITGIAVENPNVKLGQLEVQLETLTVASSSEATLPVDLFGATETEVDKRLDWRFLDLRRPENQLIFRVQTTVEMAMREYWLSNGFVEIHTPKIMGSPSEGGAELFTLDYFGQTASLAQSPQFYKQMAMAAGLDRVFEIAPAFRADRESHRQERSGKLRWRCREGHEWSADPARIVRGHWCRRCERGFGISRRRLRIEDMRLTARERGGGVVGDLSSAFGTKPLNGTTATVVSVGFRQLTPDNWQTS